MYLNVATLHFQLLKILRFCLEGYVLERFRSVILRDTSYLGPYEQQQEWCDKTGTNEKNEDRYDNVRRLESQAILSNWTFDAGFGRGTGRHRARSRQEMSVRRLVIELRLDHESQRRNSISIVKFLSHSEYRSSLSGFSSHWLMIVRSLIRSAGDDTILFFRLRRRIRFDFFNSWMRITMRVRQKSMHVRQKCARIPHWWRELHI